MTNPPYTRFDNSSVAGLAYYKIRNLPRCRVGFFCLWFLAFVLSLAIFYAFLYGCGCAVHPIKSISILEYVPTAVPWATVEGALCILEVASFAAISGLVTALCGLVWTASRRSSGCSGCKYAVVDAIRWMQYLIGAGGILLGTSVWNHHTWTSVPLDVLPRAAPAVEEYARAISQLVAFHASMNVVLLAVTVLPAVLIIDSSARRCACCYGYHPDDTSGRKWMKKNGLRFGLGGAVRSVIAVFLPALVAIVTKLIET